MRNLCNIHCKLLDDIDLFGKEPELYFKGNSKRTSWVGRIFTMFYILIYGAFFLYKLIRMIENKDVSFYQTTTFTGKTPSIHLTNEVFYGGFALANPLTLKTFVDESIYYAQAVFVGGHKEGNDWVFVPKPVEIEICQLEKFGSKYRDIFKTKNLDSLYCFKDMDVIMEGHTTYDVYSYFQITFYPCVNTTENNNMCRSPEEITSALGLSLVTVKIQDIELTPENYKKPVEVRGKELTSPAYLNLYQNIQSFFHIVHVETDLDFVGFELLKNIQTQTYFKYDDTFILPSINTQNILSAPYQPYCQISIQLTEQILTLKRSNTKLTEVLGEVGGLMEVIFSFFRIISSFLTDNLYEQALVNSLFSFDLDKKFVSLKGKQKPKKFSVEDDVKVYTPLSKMSRNVISINDDMSINTKNKLNEDNLNKKNTLNDSLMLAQTGKPTKKKKKKKVKSSFSKLEKMELNDVNYTNNLEKEKKNEEKKLEDQMEIPVLKSNVYESNNNNEKDVETNLGKRNIIDKIKISNWKICCCFLCARKFKNIQNILLDEGMRIIMEKLDIIYMFKNIMKEDKIQENYDFKSIQIDMSDECKKNLIKKM